MDSGASNYQRYLAGDDDALVALVRDYKDGLLLFLNRYVRNLSLAEELTEDTFFRLVTKRPRFSPHYSFKTWLYTIGRNTALNHLKRAGRHPALPLDSLELLRREEESLELGYLREEQKIQVHRALTQLKPDYSQVLYLKFFAELSNQESAKVMGKSKRQIENLLYQAKQALRAELEQEGFDYDGLS